MVMKALIRLLLVIQWSLSLRSRDMVNSSVTFLVAIYNHIFTISITYKIRINRTWSYMYLWWVHIWQISQRRRTSRRNKTIVWECGRNQTLIWFGYSGNGGLRQTTIYSKSRRIPNSQYHTQDQNTRKERKLRRDACYITLHEMTNLAQNKPK